MNAHITKKETERLHSAALPPGLYLVATPIGNLRDITLRALDTLAAADLILCEDTRISKKLMAAYSIDGRLQTYHDHSDESRRTAILEQVQDGKSVALISDAGMPLISDPGYKLVRGAIDLGLHVSSLPGASAVLMGLQLSGLPSDKFTFAGFVPQKAGARTNFLNEWISVPATLIAYETAPRLLKTLEALASIDETRQVAVTRELTKMYEEARHGSAAELAAHYKAEGLPKGEIVLVIAPPQEEELSRDVLEEKLRTLLETKSVKEAAGALAKETGLKRNDLYDMALGISKA